MSSPTPNLVTNMPNSQKYEFEKGFGFSLALHSIILSFFFIKFIFFSKPLIDISQAISVNIETLQNNSPEKIESSTEDKKLPPKIQEPLQEPLIEKIRDNPKETPQTTKLETKPDSINLNKVKARQKAALNKLKKSAALEKIKQALKNDSIASLKLQEKRAQASRPRIIAAGSALSGLDKLQSNNYLLEMDQNIKQFWLLPQWLINKPLKAQVLVKFNPQGQILLTKIISSSGNSSYDQYCLQAITKAAPFPKVPDKLTEKFSMDGVIIGFPE